MRSGALPFVGVGGGKFLPATSPYLPEIGGVVSSCPASTFPEEGSSLTKKIAEQMFHVKHFLRREDLTKI